MKIDFDVRVTCRDCEAVDVARVPAADWDDREPEMDAMPRYCEECGGGRLTLAYDTRDHGTTIHTDETLTN